MLNACVAGCGACGFHVVGVCPSGPSSRRSQCRGQWGAGLVCATRAGLWSVWWWWTRLMRAPRMPPVCGRAALQVLRVRALCVARIASVVSSRTTCARAGLVSVCVYRRKLGRIRDSGYGKGSTTNAQPQAGGGALFERIHTLRGCTLRSHKRHNHTARRCAQRHTRRCSFSLPSTPHAPLRLPALITTTSIRERSEHVQW